MAEPIDKYEPGFVYVGTNLTLLMGLYGLGRGHKNYGLVVHFMVVTGYPEKIGVFN